MKVANGWEKCDVSQKRRLKVASGMRKEGKMVVVEEARGWGRRHAVGGRRRAEVDLKQVC